MRAWTIILFAVLMACGTGEEALPEGLLPRDKFREVLLEAQLVEARVNHELSLGIHTSAPADRYYTELYEAKGVTAESFEATFRYYSERPEMLKSIYEEIITELSRRKDEIRQ